ncbi:hypothetical protein RchiOBHm_Chr2g0113581 [Rosa chinensis]|uniref:Uncharacterized protein n=1 Tax=Rosa chinensis TaxID=74649 RepID=A0A2P6RQH5_ROSCH|nr:hypothetical protein RchiOBHm_Chr2g0113581 [Rosa chinensis]
MYFQHLSYLYSYMFRVRSHYQSRIFDTCSHLFDGLSSRASEANLVFFGDFEEKNRILAG